MCDRFQRNRDNNMPIKHEVTLVIDFVCHSKSMDSKATLAIAHEISVKEIGIMEPRNVSEPIDEFLAAGDIA